MAQDIDIAASVFVAERTPGKLATTTITNELARAISSQGSVFQLRSSERRISHEDRKIYMVWDSGPDGEEDFENHRYWLREAYLADPGNDDPTAAAVVKETPDGEWFAATNLSERPPATSADEEQDGTHSLEKGVAILDAWLEPDAGNPSVLRWVFQSGGGGGIQPCRVKKVAGNSGGATSTCTYTYDIYRLDNTTKINTDGGPLTPKGPPRFANVFYVMATYGMYFKDDDETYALYLWNEQPSTALCNEPP